MAILPTAPVLDMSVSASKSYPVQFKGTAIGDPAVTARPTGYKGTAIGDPAVTARPPEFKGTAIGDPARVADVYSPKGTLQPQAATGQRLSVKA